MTPDLTQPLVPLPGTQFSFWVQVGTAAEDFRFQDAVGTDVGGNQVDFTCALIFASLVDTPDNLAFIQSAYRTSGKRRAAALAQQKLTFAARVLPPPPTTRRWLPARSISTPMPIPSC